jgi:hypothetical protein
MEERVKTLLNTKPAAAGAVVAAVLAVVQAVLVPATGNAGHPADWSGTVVALIAALYQAGWIHPKVTPLARPRTRMHNGDLVPLVPAPQPAPPGTGRLVADTAATAASPGVQLTHPPGQPPVSPRSQHLRRPS